ncbi:MAG: hypothetical protein HRU48_18415 [Vibrio sp.]|uniref:hypothetical protein n=1 Tax=Vibrio sp. TaxID=678 RepID=UPI001EB109FD|nr:hypothetical protein [Vibrio sp.]NRB69313.1 hypothetical protein [Vibrio sp.]
MNPKEVQLAIQALLLFYPATAFMGANLIFGAYFQSVEKVKVATNLALIRGMVLVAFFLMVLPDIFGLVGVWAGDAIGRIHRLFVNASFALF